MASLRAGLEDLLGPDGLAALSAVRGGRRMYVPRRIRPGHWIERALGRERADALAALAGGDRIYVPTRKAVGAEARDLRMLDLRRLGWNIARIAAEQGVSERTVYLVLRRYSHWG